MQRFCSMLAVVRLVLSACTESPRSLDLTVSLLTDFSSALLRSSSLLTRMVFHSVAFRASVADDSAASTFAIASLSSASFSSEERSNSPDTRSSCSSAAPRSCFAALQSACASAIASCSAPISRLFFWSRACAAVES